MLVSAAILALFGKCIRTGPFCVWKGCHRTGRGVACGYVCLGMVSVPPQMRSLRLTTGPAPRMSGLSRLRSSQAEAVPGMGLAPVTDSRWVLAARAATWIEGGRAAILTPDKRRRLMKMAESLGLRPFDASLIIAIVQDAARSGKPVLGHDTERRLGIVASGRDLDGSWSPLELLMASVFLGALICFALRSWVIGG